MKQAKNTPFISTSFHGQTILASVNQIKAVCGEPCWRGGGDKTTVEWDMLTSDGSFFTIYDWKEYREFSDDERIEFHIGGESSLHAMRGQDELRHRIEFPDIEYSSSF